MRSNGLHRPVSGSMRAMPRVLPLQRSAYSASPNCASGEGVVMHQRYSPRYEMIVEDLLELLFGEDQHSPLRCSLDRQITRQPLLSQEPGAHERALLRARRYESEGELASYFAARQRCL